MKRIIVLLTAMLCLCAGSALASGFGEARWGMDSARVGLLEKGVADDIAIGTPGWMQYNYEGRTVSRYRATRYYLFHEGILVAGGYDGFSSQTQQDAEYLEGALTALYGDPQPLTRDALSLFETNLCGADDCSYTLACRWQKDADTAVWLYRTVYGDIRIVYLSREAETLLQRVYNTDGL